MTYNPQVEHFLGLLNRTFGKIASLAYRINAKVKQKQILMFHHPSKGTVGPSILTLASAGPTSLLASQPLTSHCGQSG